MHEYVETGTAPAPGDADCCYPCTGDFKQYETRPLTGEIEIELDYYDTDYCEGIAGETPLVATVRVSL